MTKHAICYWSLSLVAATTILAWHEEAGGAASRMGGRQVAGAAPAQAAAPLDARVGAVVKSEILASGVPSVSVAVMRDGRMLLARAWGVADVERNAAASSATIYDIGSVTKQFTAALLLKQVDRGRLTLTDTISKHFAGLSPEVGAVTIEQLLNHTSGMKRPVTDRARRLEHISAESLLENATGSKLDRTPATTWAYSNAGYTVLGVLVERLYGKSYAAALQDEIARPLQLPTLSKCGEPKAGEARGYVREQVGKFGPAPGMHHSQNLGAGGICATAADLVKWTHALHTGRVISPSSYQAMITPRGAAIGSNYGFGLAQSRANGGQMAIVHDGNSPGTAHTAELRWYQKHSLAVAVLSNGFPLVPPLKGAADVVSRIVLGGPLAAPAATHSTATTTPADRSTLVGIYELAPQRTFEVTLENGELYVTPPGGAAKQPLVFRSGNAYALGTRDSTTTVTFFVEKRVAIGFEANANGMKRMLKKVK